MRGLVIGGAASSTGKTVVSLAVMRALERAGYDVQPAKAGPDFIDPSHHAAVAGRPSRTLDLWLAGNSGVRRTYHRGEGDICVVEGVMGLYDGGDTSTAAVAAALDLPVVLVLDAAGSMESLGAAVLGFREYAGTVGCDVDVVGVIANRAGGGRHERGIRRSLPQGVSYYGRIPSHDGLEIPERHLGLLSGEEEPVDDDALDEAADHVDAEGLAAIARTPPMPAPRAPYSPTGARIAVARDQAFRFVYPSTTELLGARTELVPFAPTNGEDLPACDGVYLPGGYPELHAESLSSSPALETLRTRAEEGLPILAECGGFMVLAEALTDVDGRRHQMAGILPAKVRQHQHFQALDHVELRAQRSTLTARSGETLRGHEFHYSSADPAADARFAFEVTRGSGIDGEHDGMTEYATLGTYAHVHPESGAFDTFIEAIT